MDVDAELVRLVNDALKNRQPVNPVETLLGLKDLAITVNPEYIGYFNPRVMRAIDRMSASEIGRLKFEPLPEAGIVILLPAAKGEDDGVEFSRSPSGNTARMNLRAALVGFDLDFAGKRRISLPFVTVPQEDNTKPPVGVIRVKGPVRKPAVKRRRKSQKPPA